MAGLVRSAPRRGGHSGAEGRCDQGDEEHHRPGHPEAHLKFRVVHLHHDEVPEEHDEVPEEHGDVGHQGADPGHQTEKETDHEKTEEELPDSDDGFHEMFDSFLSSGCCGFLSPT